MQRSTKEITTSGGHVVVMYEYITGREMRQIQDVFLRKMEVSTTGSLGTVNASAASEAQDVALNILLVSIDDDGFAVADKVLDLPSTDFQEVIDAVNAITNAKKK